MLVKGHKIEKGWLLNIEPSEYHEYIRWATLLSVYSEVNVFLN
jgi:hypothetical protein